VWHGLEYARHCPTPLDGTHRSMGRRSAEQGFWEDRRRRCAQVCRGSICVGAVGNLIAIPPTSTILCQANAAREAEDEEQHYLSCSTLPRPGDARGVAAFLAAGRADPATCTPAAVLATCEVSAHAGCQNAAVFEARPKSWDVCGHCRPSKAGARMLPCSAMLAGPVCCACVEVSSLDRAPAAQAFGVRRMPHGEIAQHSRRSLHSAFAG